MSHSKKSSSADESPREKEPPAHRTRRAFKQTISDYVGYVDEDFLEEEEVEVSHFEPIKRTRRGNQ